MPEFKQHLNQAKKNIEFLRDINNISEQYYDWQVTTCFYTALHIINAHLAKYNLHYNTHVEVARALNFAVAQSVSKVSPECFVAYRTLQNLSRKARYLSDPSSKTYIQVYEVHLSKAIGHLDTVITYFSKKYSDISFPICEIKCDSLKGSQLTNFKKIS